MYKMFFIAENHDIASCADDNNPNSWGETTENVMFKIEKMPHILFPWFSIKKMKGRFSVKQNER